jgi:TRAP-type C4-dicarboxylate transport system permease small subunit
MIKRLLASILLIGCCLLATPLSVQAADILGSSAECNNGSYDTGSSAICTDNGAVQGNKNDDPVVDKLRDITSIIAIIAGAAAILLLLVGSIQYITSNGDSNKVGSAKNTIIYALVGLVVIVLAVSIIELILSRI